MTSNTDNPKAVRTLKKSYTTHHAHTKSSRWHKLHAGLQDHDKKSEAAAVPQPTTQGDPEHPLPHYRLNHLEQCDLAKGKVLGTSADLGTTQFRFLTWNVMGFTTMTDELELIIGEQDPDIIVLTEAKFVRDQHGSASIRKPFLGKHNIFCSSVAASTRAQKLIRNKEDRQILHQRSGAGGVLLAVHNRWQPEASVHLHTHSQEPWLASYAIGVTAPTQAVQAAISLGFTCHLKAGSDSRSTII